MINNTGKGKQVAKTGVSALLSDRSFLVVRCGEECIITKIDRANMQCGRVSRCPTIRFLMARGSISGCT